MSHNNFTFTDTDGFEIFVNVWTPEKAQPVAVVQLAHGAAEHSLRYSQLAAFLNKAGFIVYANDHRGHGQTAQSQDKAGIAGNDGWNGIVADLKQLSDIIKQNHPELPLFLLGHSLGSLMTQQYLQHWGNELSGAILSGTFGDSPGVEELIPILEQAAELAPEAPSQISSAMFAEYNKPFEPGETGFEWLSRDKAEVQKYVDDPWCGFTFCNQLVKDNLLGALQIWSDDGEKAIPNQLPLLFIYGDCDPAGRNGESVRGLIQRYKDNGIEDISSIAYPKARHEVFNETNREQVYADVLSWLQEHTP